MNLKALYYFIAVVEEKSLSRAAQRLCMAQPPLTRQIQNLEESVGTRLLFRERPIRLTEAGEYLYAQSKELLAQYNEILLQTRNFSKPRKKFTIGFVASTIHGLLPTVVRRFKQLHPELTIHLQECNSSEQIQALRDNRIDVGFSRTRIEDSLIRRIVLREEELVVALPKEHELSQRNKSLRLTDLINENLFIYPQYPRPSFADLVIALFKDHGLTMNRMVEVSDLDIALGLVAAGEGIAIIPTTVAFLKPEEISYLKFADKTYTSPIIYSHRIHDTSPEIHDLLHLIYRIYQENKTPYFQHDAYF